MKKNFALAWLPFALLAALAMPGSASASTGFTFKIVDQHCISGGHNIYFRVSATAAGSTAANKMTIKSTSQYLSGGTWHNSYHWRTNTSTFTPSGEAHTIDHSYTHENNSDSRQWRIGSVLKALQGNHVLAHKTLTSRAC